MSARDQSMRKDSFHDHHSLSRNSHYGAQNNTKRNSVESETQRKRRRHEPSDDYDSDAEYLNFDKLKKFHIPRKKSHEEREILAELSMKSREYTHTIYPTFRSSFFDPQACRKLTIHRVETVRNHNLEKEYSAKKKELKDEGRSDKEVSDSFGYLHYLRRSEVEKVCRDGVTVGHSNLASLGKPNMGVYISKHADIVRFTKWEDGLTGYIIMFKIMKGKTKVVLENRSPVTEQEPTPLYDCHLAKIPIDVAQSSHSRAFIGFQYYLYEYGDLDIVERPRQVLPYAVLKYSYSDASNSVIAAAHGSRRESLPGDASFGSCSSLPHLTLSCDNGFCHWRGKLLVKNGTFCSVEIRSHIDTVFNVANMDRNINVKSYLPLTKLSRHLPPTMMSKTAKKYNVIYRGRHYNTFTLHPVEEGSGLGKFRQLIGLLVQQSAVAFVPLHNNSTMFLLPMSELTMDLGLVNYSPETTESDSAKQTGKAWKNFLHVIIITPKVLSSKINDQRLFNIVRARKRKDAPSQTSSTLKDILESKLRMMNIDPYSALSVEQDQYQKIYDRVKNKKRVQNSEKMLHTHYKETDAIMSTTSKAIWIKNLATAWSSGARQQQELYATKKKLKVMPSPKHTASVSKSSDGVGDVAMDDHAEATFSDDDDGIKSSDTHKKHRYEEPRGRSQTQDPRNQNREDPRLSAPNKLTPMPYLPLPAKLPVASGKSCILRPSFKPLEELIFCGQLQELLRHPEFSFSETYCLSHKVEGFVSSSFMSWDESHPPLKITFPQIVPYKLDTADCPYAFENDVIILSMLRAIHGEYNGDDDSLEEHEKVKWVRKILHNHSSEAFRQSTQSVDVSSSKIENLQKPSPQFTGASPHPSSTDSGFVSSSSAATPGNAPVLDAVSPSLKDIASILASALNQTQATEHVDSNSKAVNCSNIQGQLEKPDMELAAKALLEVLAHSTQAVKSNEPGNDEELDGVDMELGSTPGEPSAVLHSIALGTPLAEQSQDDHTADPSVSTVSPLPQGKVTAGKGHSRHPQSHHHFQHQIQISQEKALLALQKIAPGCTMNIMLEILRKVAMKMKEKKIKTDGNNTTIPKDILKKKEIQGGPKTVMTTEKTGMIKLGTMATKVTTETDITTRSTGMIVEKTATRGTILRGTGGHSTGKQAMSGILPHKMSPRPTIGVDPRKERLSSGVTAISRSAYSIIDRKKTHEKNFMTMNCKAISVKDTHYSANAPLNIGNITMTKGGQKQLDAGHSSRIPTMTHIKPTINSTLYRNPMYHGVGPPNPFPNMYQCPEPFYPTQVPVAHPHYLVPVPPPHVRPFHQPELNPVGGNIGFPNSMDSLGTISKQNTELLNSIIALMNREHTRIDPRSGRPVSSGRQSHKSSFPPQLQPADIAMLMPQINDLLMQASSAPLPSKSVSVAGVKSPVFLSGSAASSLSLDDIRRIREKKEKMKSKRHNEKEMCKREAMRMREELNKNLDKMRKNAKQHKTSHQPDTSPADSTRSGEGGNDKQKAPKLTPSKVSDFPSSLDQPASLKVLQSVAAALASPSTSNKLKASENETLPRPTGIVTPKPRPVHPIFMESRSSFPLTESTQMQQSIISSSSTTPDDRTRVISEIDQTLSVLKQEMRVNRNNTDVKDSMSKLLQLVIKLGGVTSNDDQSDTYEKPGTSGMVGRRHSSGHPSSENSYRAGPVSNPATCHRRALRPPDKTERFLNLAETPRDTIPFISDSSVIPFITDDSAFSHHPSNSYRDRLTETTGTTTGAWRRPDDPVIPFISDGSPHSRMPRGTVAGDTVSEEFPVSTSTGAGRYATQNIDELLSKVKPAIESLNRMQSLDKTDRRHFQRSSVGEKFQVIGSGSSNSEMTESVQRPANFTAVPSTDVNVLRPSAVSALTDIQPILSLAKNPRPVTVMTLDEEPFTDSVKVKTPETDVVDDTTMKAKCLSPSSKCDRGTPTLDERYPELAVTENTSKIETKSNPFYVFNPDRSMECEAICLYLESVHGIYVDTVEIFGKLRENLKALDKHLLDVDMMKNQYNAILPTGILWIVFRSDDVSRVHLVPNIALLKAAGSRVQFVSATCVRDVRMRRYKDIFPGDGGIIVPLCPKTVFSKSDSFLHILMWLVGQGKGLGSTNRWRIGLHHHILNALQLAHEIDNAQKIAEWVCHANDVKPRVLIELPKHHCDFVPSSKGNNGWNVYDQMSDEKLAKSVLRCAIRLQEDRAGRLRHVVFLIDGDPGAMCWQPIWQCGICVVSVEVFAEQMCSKQAEMPRHPSTSCVLPLYKHGLPCLIENVDKGLLEI